MWWQGHQLDHMQIIRTLLQTDNHASTLSLNFLQVSCSSWRPTNSVKAPKANETTFTNTLQMNNGRKVHPACNYTASWTANWVWWEYFTLTSSLTHPTSVQNNLFPFFRNRFISLVYRSIQVKFINQNHNENIYTLSWRFDLIMISSSEEVGTQFFRVLMWRSAVTSRKWL